MVEPQPPKWILDAMSKFNGMEPRLITTKKVLFASDLNQSQTRLMLPANKFLSKKEFRREEEIRVLEGSSKATRTEGVHAIFVDPDFKTYGVSLKQWKNMVVSRWNPVLDDFKTLNDVPSSKDEECFCLDDFPDFPKLDLFHFLEEYANVDALPDLGYFENTDVVASFYDDA
ncbi:unnamed protein product [Eruca vesicaria subsp. sativa]|uniref:Uncharacterized protein n=1 Tax=Eruca vesicaria subsp. sativa TaxID=29727 RepID=A0ABC8IV52_ERUVS|nr:unnamed protein product [Eruca vesicaria subsp. sativa]